MARTSRPDSPAPYGLVPPFVGEGRVRGRSDVPAAAALRGDADEGGHQQQDAGDEQPDPEDQSQHGEEGPHPEDERPDAGAGERVDDPGAVADVGVVAVFRAIADGPVEGAPEEELGPSEPAVPGEVVEAGQQTEGAGADQHHEPAVLVAEEPVDEADGPEEDADPDQEDRLDPHATGTFSLVPPLPSPGGPPGALVPWCSEGWSGWLE